MQLEQAANEIKDCVKRMNARYGDVVFDEWAIVPINGRDVNLLYYFGSRSTDFRQQFAVDAGDLLQISKHQQYAIGDFEFARHAVGTSFECFIVIGAGLLLICNNTESTMDIIAREPAWLEAPQCFAELSEKFRTDPVVI